MAKTPRTRHSNTKREPVTIDLEADPVRRDTDESKKAAPGQAEEVEQAADATPAAETGSEPWGSEDREAAGSAEGSEDHASADGDTQDTEMRDNPAAEPVHSEKSSRGGGGRALAAGMAGGIVALVLAGALQWANILPVPGGREDAAEPAVDNLRQDVEAMKTELSQLQETASAGPSGETVEQALAEPRQQIGELRETVTALEQAVASGEAGGNAGLETLNTRLSDLESRLADVAESAGQATGDAGLADRVSGLASELESLRGAVSANAERLEALGGHLETLADQVGSQDEGPRLARVVAASALRSAVERGEPFAGELETYSALAPETQALEPLRKYSESGIPTRVELSDEAPEVASRITAAASAPPDDAGFLDRLMASARSAIAVRPVGEVEGETPAAIAARMEAAVMEGDYQRALAEYEALPPDAQEAAGDFAEKLRARQAADRVLEEALSSALSPA